MALAKALSADGLRVKGSTTTPEKMPILKAGGIEPFLIDLSDQSAFEPDFFNCDILVIAIPPKARSGEGSHYLPKLQTAITSIKTSDIKKVILISSTGVYADLNKEITEVTDPAPNRLSGVVLLEAEQLFKKQTAFKTTIIRLGGLFGPGRDPGRFFAGKKDIPNGLAPVNLIHLDDCIGVTKAVINQELFGYTINACSPHHPLKQDFYRRGGSESRVGTTPIRT